MSDEIPSEPEPELAPEPDTVVVTEDVVLVADISNEDADRELAAAVKGRTKVARAYVRWVRRRNLTATPAETVALLERHYITAVSVAGAAVTVGTIGIGLLPGGGVATGGLKAFALGAAKLAASSKVMPAADEQMQFEVTALFALALADIHGMHLDTEQQKALVFLLSSGQAGHEQVAAFATRLADAASTPSSPGAVSPPADTARGVGPHKADAVAVGEAITAGHADWSNWASTLADSLPGEGAQSLVRSVQTGKLEGVRQKMGAKKQTAAEMSVGAIAGGATRFLFGRAVVASARDAFPPAPSTFPDHLDLPPNDESDVQAEPNRALSALEDAARTVSSGLSAGAATVGSGVATAASTVSRPFRSVDLDGDGIPDEARAVTAAKGAGKAAGAAGSRALNVFRSVDLDGDGVPDEAKALTAAKGTGAMMAGAAGAVKGKAGSLFKKKPDQHDTLETPDTGADASE